MLTPLAQVFGALVLALKVDLTPPWGRRDDDTSNSKMKREDSRFPLFIEAFVLSLEEVRAAQEAPRRAGRGGYREQARLERGACSQDCPHYHSNLGYDPDQGGPIPPRGDRCYVDLMRVIDPAINRAARDLASGAAVDLKAGGFELRLTGWGDVARLNDQGLAEVARLQALSGDHLSYSAGWRDPRLTAAGLEFEASAAGLEEALEAEALGLKVYMSGPEAEKQAFRRGASSPVYRCPVSDGRSQSLGCTTCPLRCNGARHILSP